MSRTSFFQTGLVSLTYRKKLQFLHCLQKKILKVYYKLSHDYKNFSMRLMDIETVDINKMLSAMRESMSKNNFSGLKNRLNDDEITT